MKKSSRGLLAWLACIVPLLTVGAGAPAQPTRTLYVADVCQPAHGVCALTRDEQLVFTALQGIVNRNGPRIYLEGMDSTAPSWLKNAVPLPVRQVDPYDLLRLFRPLVRGVVIWDPALAVDSKNVATSMAGIYDTLPVGPETSRPPRLAALVHGLPIRADLRGRFQNRNQAYDWALASLKPLSRFTHLAWLGGASRERHGLRDYIVAKRGFAFEAEPQKDHDLIKKLLAAFPQNTPVLGYPFFNDQLYEGSCKAGQCLPLGEPLGVGEISQAGDFLVPTDLASNLTVHSSFKPIKESPAWDDHPRSINVPGDLQKTYVAFVISDGDNVGYNEQEVMQAHFSDPARGKIPMGISFSTRLPIMAPRIYDYYVHQLNKAEVLVAGPSGAGYVYPTQDPALDGYLQQTRRLLDMSGLKALWILDNGYAYSPPPTTLNRYVNALHPSALVTDYFGWVTPNPPAVSFVGGVPVVHAIWGDSVQTTEYRIRLSSASAGARPAFVLVALNTWSMGHTQALKVMQDLQADPGSSYEVVRPDQFFGLVRGAYGLLGAVPPIA
jgi:hypothetical protein